MLSIYNYDDFRAFLFAYYTYQKSASERFSFRILSRKIGFSSPNFLKLVIDGKRQLSPRSVIRLMEVLEFSKEESDYFQTLVFLNQARTDQERSYYAHRLTEIRGRLEIAPSRVQQSEYFSKWYYVAIREMVSLKNFRADPVWIASRLQPSITVAEAQEALQKLAELWLIRRENGRWVRVVPNLSYEPEMDRRALKSFHKTMIQKAATALDLFPSDLREVCSLTVAVPKSQIGELKETLHKFQRHLHAATENSDDKEVVLQINLQLYPLTEISRHNGTKQGIS